MLVSPPGWPREVRPPDAPDWERTACSWLLDQCPPDYRAYPALRRHPVVLARFAMLHIEANQAACRRGLSEARSGLREARGPRREHRAHAARPGWSKRPCAGGATSRGSEGGCRHDS